jgi:hypothetical protein
MPNSRVVEFRGLATIPDPKPAKARLRPDVRVSVQRSIDKLPVLGQRNPAAALLIERSIDDYMPPPDDDGGQEQPPAYPAVVRGIRRREVDPLRRLQAELEQAREEAHRSVMAMLRDMAGDLSAAS